MKIVNRFLKKRQHLNTIQIFWIVKIRRAIIAGREAEAAINYLTNVK